MMNEFLKLAIHAAVKAGSVIEAIYNHQDYELEIKKDNSPLTKADIAANTVIDQYLKESEIPIISEENKEIDFEVRKHWDKCWIVDPLDGTKEFLRRNGEFTVNIALVIKGVPILGVIFCPISKELFYGNVQEKALYKVVINKENRATEDWFKDAYKVEPKVKLDATFKVVGSRSHMNDLTKDFIKNLAIKYPSVEIVSKGSSLKFCLIAVGDADIYPRFGPTMEWDTAAGQAICEAAGFQVLSKTTLEALSYNKRNLFNSDFVVSNKRVSWDKKWIKKETI